MKPSKKKWRSYKKKVYVFWFVSQCVYWLVSLFVSWLPLLHFLICLSVCLLSLDLPLNSSFDLSLNFSIQKLSYKLYRSEEESRERGWQQNERQILTKLVTRGQIVEAIGNLFIWVPLPTYLPPIAKKTSKSIKKQTNKKKLEIFFKSCLIMIKNVQHKIASAC